MAIVSDDVNIIVNKNPLYLPRESSNLDLVESAFLGKGGVPKYHVAVGLGAPSRSSQCVARHFNSALCWGTFDGEATRFVNAKDLDTTCALETNRICSSQVGRSDCASNTLETYHAGPPAKAPCCNARSYGSYASCPNCGVTGGLYACQRGSDDSSYWDKTTCCR